jgi:hypothetical protein
MNAEAADFPMKLDYRIAELPQDLTTRVYEVASKTSEQKQ